MVSKNWSVIYLFLTVSTIVVLNVRNSINWTLLNYYIRWNATKIIVSRNSYNEFRLSRKAHPGTAITIDLRQNKFSTKTYFKMRHDLRLHFYSICWLVITKNTKEIILFRTVFAANLLFHCVLLCTWLALFCFLFILEICCKQCSLISWTNCAAYTSLNMSSILLEKGTHSIF